jgi:hypothetical protein
MMVRKQKRIFESKKEGGSKRTMGVNYIRRNII